MKKRSWLISLIFFGALLSSEEIVTTSSGKKVILYDDHTWVEIESDAILGLKDGADAYRASLRKGIKATEEEISTASEMSAQGWKYTMPVPKSRQAAWGNGDGRTTWYNGFWHNLKTGQYSDTTPKKSQSGLYLGDNQNSANTWRNGGSPAEPDVCMYLLSDDGGP